MYIVLPPLKYSDSVRVGPSKRYNKGLYIHSFLAIVLICKTYCCYRRKCFKGTGSRDNIKIFGQKRTGLRVNKYGTSPGLWISKCSSDEMSSLPFLSRFKWKHFGELIFIGDTSKEIFCSLRCFLLVHCVNSWFLLVHCSSFNAFFKIAKKPFENRGKAVKFVCGPRRLLPCS